MAEVGLCRLLDILRSLYPTVQTIEEYVDGVTLSDGRKVALVEDSDTSRFKALLKGLIVCVEKPMKDAPSSDQLSTLPEVLAYVLNTMMKNKNRNVLKFGYLWSDKDGDADPFKFHGVITMSPAFIHSSDLWKKINQRLGTDLTQHLLRNCSLFTAAPPTCLFQVCGVPVYDLMSANASFRFLLCKPPSQPPPANPPWNSQWRRSSTKVRSQEVSRKRKRENGKECAGDDEGLPGKRRRCPAVERTCDSAGPSHNTNIINSEQTSHHNINATQAINENSCVSRHPKRATGTAQATATSHGSFSWKPADQPSPRPSECFIRMLRVLYGGGGLRGFLLNRKLATCGANGPRGLQGPDVVRLVFLQGEAYLRGEEPRPRRLPRRFFNMAPLFSRLLRNHRKCPYFHFMRKKCSVATTAGTGPGSDMAFLLAAHCLPYRVYLFVRECLLYVVPEELWGSEQNRALFLTRVKQLLRLGKFESLSLAHVMWRVKVRDCHWLGLKARVHCPSEHRYRKRLLGQFLAWLLDSYVLGLVKATFYVTESMGRKHALRFYRREVWNKLRNLAFREHQSKGQWQTLTPLEVASLPKTTVTARLRFIPKTHGMRPITRVVGTDPVTKRFQRSVKNLRDVLGVCVKSSPTLLGSTVWGRQDIHRVLKTTAQQQKTKPTPLYFVKVDISGAYDSLPHDKLVRVVSEVLLPVQDVAFSVRQYAKVWSDPLQGLRKQFCTRAEAQACINMKGFVMQEQENGKLHNAILVENYNSPDIKGGDLLAFFKQMLKSCVVRFGKQTFRQVCGIPQGSVVSSMLCNLCYGHMEKSLLSHVTEKGGCLMRLVDDSLLITPKLNRAMYFLKTLLAGVPQYGCVVNPQKVAVNFPLEEGVRFPGVQVLPQHCLFPWCGLLLDTQSLDVSNDYSSYAGLSLRYSLTLGSSRSPALFMRRKLMTILRLKCDAIMLDLRTNSLETVYKNIYKIVLLQAMRFHVCMQGLPKGQTVGTNPVFFLRMVWAMAKTTYNCIKQNNHDGALGSAYGGCLRLKAVQLLYCLAFEWVFVRYRNTYRCLLPRLRQRKWSLERALKGMRLARVRQAATPRVPPDFKAIRA
ncbi:telomerase reverse transcriptase isoform X1 [Alosa pseudoharengus]|uniref:telomerase reverse transcriptase isoform X1 n=1 Tax=Alosa pseudoharengus TaxID=34774 RepID=UPI003F88CC2A